MSDDANTMIGEGKEGFDFFCVIESLPDMVLLASRCGKIHYINKKFGTELGYDRQSVVGRDICTIVSDQDLVHILGFETAFGGKNVLQVNTIFVDADGDTRPFIVNSTELERYGDGLILLVARNSSEMQRELADTTRWAVEEQDRALELQKAKNAVDDANARLREAQRKIAETSRVAGMAEVATGILHNVGNVLTSVNVSVDVICEQIRTSKAQNLEKIADLIHPHLDDLSTFLSEDEKGKRVIPYFLKLVDVIRGEHERLVEEGKNVRDRVSHIKQIVAQQQDYAKCVVTVEECDLPALVEEVLSLGSHSFGADDVEFDVPDTAFSKVVIDRHRVMQIMVNLVTNAQHALQACNQKHKSIRIEFNKLDDAEFEIRVIDNGVGIATGALSKIFTHGFTTKAKGHGFGLHNAANSAGQMGGSLKCESEGPGFGAVFVLRLPIAAKERIQDGLAAA